MGNILIVLVLLSSLFQVDSVIRIHGKGRPVIDKVSYICQEAYFTQPITLQVDHFSFTTNDTFQLRYLINDTYWKKDGGNSGPIFFYTGNEGPVEYFANNTGFMWDIAPEYNALLIFAEHRYYGKSLPYGNLSFTGPKYFGYLTTEQALADFATMLTSFKANVSDARSSPIITFGGSYGGMLSAWFRMKYPHIVAGAIAASAPIFSLGGMQPPTACGTVSQAIAKHFNDTSVECAETIRKSWEIINALTNTTDGKIWLTGNWELCDNLTSTANVTTLKSWLENMWFYIAMFDYPYEANFLEPLPSYPVKEVCKFMSDSTADNETLLMNIYDALNLYFNYTGNTICMDIENGALGDQSVGDVAWIIQTCSDMVMPSCADGINDIFEPSPWNLTEYISNCVSRFGIKPSPISASITYGGRNLKTASNIVFSNGLLDPWHKGGVLKSVSSSVVAIIIPEGAHHLDLRASNPADPLSVIQARNLERMYIDKWIKEEREYYKNNKVL